MVKIRLRRVGSKKQASFRVVVADSRSPRDGRFIEEIGFYNPRTEPETLRIDEERALYWLNVGARPTDSAARLLRSMGTMDRFERLRQGEALEDLVAEAEAPEEEEAEEAPDAELPEEQAEEQAPVAEAAEASEAGELEPEEATAEDEAEQEAGEPEANVEESESEVEAKETEEEEESEE